MTYEEKLDILKNILKQHNLSYEDEEVFGFFNDERATQPRLYDKNAQKYGYSVNIGTIEQKVNPLQFENAYYAHDHNLNTLLDWFMYENAGSNPLAWENIGNPKFDVKSSFEADKRKQPVKVDLLGNYFNDGDGNHRLATIIINCIIDYVKAKTDQEKQAVIQKYTMTLPVQIPVNSLLCNLLDDEWRKYVPFLESKYPEEVREYRESTFLNNKESRCFVKFNPETKLFSYNSNGVQFVGTEKELTDFLYNKKEEKEPIMQWYGGGYYYLSCNNKVFKSKDEEEIKNLKPLVQAGYEKGDFDLYNFVEIKDLDTNTYEIVISQEYMQDKKQALLVANKVQTLLLDNLSDTIWDKLEDNVMWKSDLKERVKYESIHFNGFTMPKLCFNNLTKQEYRQLKDVVDEITMTIKFLKDDAHEI